ncbi:hypothetical protein [Chryseobacterium gambrini]|uniref:hypothetical protein n=1 Tax=Chryseobacterium gambrini TaxID=373672 RepID=UPI003D11A3D6
MYNSTIKPKKGQCVDCPEGSENFLTAGRCSYHYKIHRANVNGGPKKIAKRSKKGQKEDRQYTIKRLQFLAQPGNQRCFVEGCNNRADTVEHTAGRWGSNYLDESTWKPCCNYHNLEFERNSELSEKYQVSKISGKQKIIKR